MNSVAVQFALWWLSTTLAGSTILTAVGPRPQMLPGPAALCPTRRHEAVTGRRAGWTDTAGQGATAGTMDVCPSAWLQCAPNCGCCFQATRIDAVCCGSNVTDVPTDLPANITNLTLRKTGIVSLGGVMHRLDQIVGDSKFCQYRKLKHLSLSENLLLEQLEIGAFEFTCEQQPLGLQHLLITRSPRLTKIEKGVFGNFQSLQTLQIRWCGITSVPLWGIFSPGKGQVLESLDLQDNSISRVHGHAFSDIEGEVGTLYLDGNYLEEVEDYAFSDFTAKNIYLRNNVKLKHLGEKAFARSSIIKLDLSNTSIEYLPTAGLTSVEELVLEDVPSLKIFPPVLRLSSIRVARLTYPYHCCAFAHPEIQDETLYHHLSQVFACSQTTEAVTTAILPLWTEHSLPQQGQPDPSHHNRRVPRWLKRTLENTPVRQGGRTSTGSGPAYGAKRRDRRSQPTGFFRSGWGAVLNDTTETVLSPTFTDMSKGEWHMSTINSEHRLPDVTCGMLVEKLKQTNCTPVPDAFNPCEDVMGYVWLRVVVWFVVSTALVGNLTVMAVTVSSRYKLTVAKFLMCNLSTADLCLGSYLLILASYDIHTKGVYFAYAIPWQLHGGCQIAGFLSTFSICLSIFTLTVITLERWYAISHAINLSKRLHLKQATTIMICGWMYAVIMATLPLIGVSRYGKTSLCLPMETGTVVDKAYVLTLLVTNAFAFIVICTCYIDMYRQVTSPENTTAAGRNDANIAKRMAVLVFTDFACLFPIAFFGLTAAAGRPFITVTQSKILLVFFLPLNSCANPFLYAIFTNQFKKDVFGMLGRCGLCLHNAVRYRTMYLSYPVSNSHSSRNNTQNTTRPSVATILTSLCSNDPRASKPSLIGSPKVTPQTSPKLKRFPAHSNPTTNGVRHPMVLPLTMTASSQEPVGRKLGVVIEANHTCSNIRAELHRSVCDNGDGLSSSPRRAKDDVTEAMPRTVRSVSQYNAHIVGNIELQKMGSVDYDKLERRKGSEQTTMTSSTDLSMTDTSIFSDSSLMEGRQFVDSPIPESAEHEQFSHCSSPGSDGSRSGTTSSNMSPGVDVGQTDGCDVSMTRRPVPLPDIYNIITVECSHDQDDSAESGEESDGAHLTLLTQTTTEIRSDERNETDSQELMTDQGHI